MSAVERARWSREEVLGHAQMRRNEAGLVGDLAVHCGRCGRSVADVDPGQSVLELQALVLEHAWTWHEDGECPDADHQAVPGRSMQGRCARCGRRIRSVPGPLGAAYVHDGLG